MPRTPEESRPANTRKVSSAIWKRMHRPSRVASSTSSPSRQVATPIRRSPSSSFMAIRPEARTLRKSDSRLRRTVPLAVANTRCRLSHSASSCGRGNTAVMPSPPNSGNRFTKARPLAAGPASGKRQTFSRNALPPLLKNNTHWWVWALKLRVTTSSPRVPAAVRPRPPRFCWRNTSSAVRLMKPSRVIVTTI